MTADSLRGEGVPDFRKILKRRGVNPKKEKTARIPIWKKLPGRSSFLANTIEPFAIASFIIPFSVYLLTLAPSVTFFDSGEFLTAAASLGSAHSPGYPLFLMYVKPFTLIPLGNVAFRVNMATAFSSSAASLGVYILARHFLKKELLLENATFSSFCSKTASLAAALTFGASPRLWLQSNHDKPYPLVAFIASVIFYLLVKWGENHDSDQEKPSYIYASFFLASVAFAAHQTVILFLPAWAFFIIATDRRALFRVKELLITFFFALAGFSVHLYLPLRASVNPLLNWGDTDSYSRFLWHFLRRGYPVQHQERTLSLLWEQLKVFNLPREFTWLGVVLVILGFFFIWKRHRIFAMTSLLAVILFLSVVAGYLNTPAETVFLTEEFFTPVYLLAAVFSGFGLFQLLIFAIGFARGHINTGAKLYLISAAIFLLLPVSQYLINYYENNQRYNYIAYDYATNTLRTVKEGGVLFTWGDSGAFPLWYLQGVERMREDIDLPHTPHLVFDWYLDSLPRLFANSRLRKFELQKTGAEGLVKAAIAETIGSRPVYIDFSTRYSIDFTDYTPFQKGVIYRIRRNREPLGLPDISVWENYNSRGITERISFADMDTAKAILIYANSYLEAGEAMMALGYPQKGREMLDKCVRISPEMKKTTEQVMLRYGEMK